MKIPNAPHVEATVTRMSDRKVNIRFWWVTPKGERRDFLCPVGIKINDKLQPDLEEKLSEAMARSITRMCATDAWVEDVGEILEHFAHENRELKQALQKAQTALSQQKVLG